MKVSALHYSNSIIDLEKLFGMQVMEINELNRLRSAGVEASLFTRKFEGQHNHIFEIPYNQNDKNLFDIPYYTRFLEVNESADILQGNATPLLAAFKPQKTIIRFDGFVPFLFTDNESLIECYQNVHYIFVSSFLKSWYLNRYPFLPENKCHVLYNAVQFQQDYIKKKNKKKQLLFCSRWISDKGINVLNGVMKYLEKKRDDYELLLAGGIHTTGASAKQKEHESRIQKIFSQRKNVKILGYLQHENLLKLLKKTDILLFPSIWDEPFGLVPAEAAMASVPTIAFSVGALPEVVLDGDTGLLVKKSRFQHLNAKRYAKAIEKCLDDDKLTVKMGQKARQRCLDKFQWPDYIKHLLQIYSRVTGN